MLHVDMSNMSNQVPLHGRSTCNEHTCNRNVHKLFLTAHKPVWCLNHPYLNRDMHVNISVSALASQSRITTKLPIKLYISNTTTVLHGQKQSWEIIQTRCDQLTGPHGSCQILHCWYTSQPPCSPVSQR